MRRQKLNRKDFQKILEESPYYRDEQTWKLDAGQNVPIPNVAKIWSLGSCACVYLVYFQLRIR